MKKMRDTAVCGLVQTGVTCILSPGITYQIIFVANHFKSIPEFHIGNKKPQTHNYS